MNQGLAEKLDPHLVEVKHHGKLKIRHREPLAHGNFSIPCYTERTGGLFLLPAAGSKHTWEMVGRPNSEHQVSHGISPATPGINQHSPLGRLTTPPGKKKLTNLMIKN
jgi:hypothetical protein